MCSHNVFCTLTDKEHEIQLSKLKEVSRKYVNLLNEQCNKCGLMNFNHNKKQRKKCGELKIQ